MNAIEFGDWIVEPRLGRIRSGDEQVHLEPKALQVLECLLANPGEVVPQAVLLDTVWNGRVVETSAVPRNIATLRRAIGDDARSPEYIETVPKQGYRAIAPVRRLTSEPGINKPDHAPIAALRLAVLPFQILDAEPHTSFVAGLREELVDQLVKLDGISVLAATHGIEETDGKAAQTERGAGVRYVLQGTVRFRNGDPRASVRLRDTQSDAYIWSASYDCNGKDPIEAQSRIAIATAADLDVAVKSRRFFPRSSTKSLKAHTNYINALAALSSSLDLGLAHKELDRAIELEPYFALAISMKAYLTSAVIDRIGPNRPTTVTTVRRLASDAQRLAERALALDDKQALAYCALAHLDTYHRRWATRHAHILQAYRLDPHDVRTLFAYGMRSYELRRNDDANRLFVQAMEREPTNAAVPGFAALRAFWAQEWEVLKLLAGRVIELRPEVGQGYAMLATAQAYTGDSADARTTARKAAERLKSSNDFRDAARVGGHGSMTFLMHVWQKLGEPDEADELLSRLANIDDERMLNPGEWMMAHLACGNTEQALSYLETTIRDSFPIGRVRDLKYYPEHPVFYPIRDEVRFDLALRKVQTKRVD